MSRRPRVLFLGSGFAGHRTRVLNLQKHVQDDGRLEPVFRLVSGWKTGGLIERLPVGGAGARGALRSMLEAGALASLPRPDAIWTAGGTSLTPWLWSQIPPLRRPLVVDFDWTVEQREAWSREYFGRKPRTGARLKFARLQERALWGSARVLTPWSHWAAGAAIDAGVRPEKVRVIPPGVDLNAWATDRRASPHEGPLRLLFVGGDLDRKGGRILADVVRERFAERCQLDVVTHDDLDSSPTVRVHRASPNSPELRELYGRADIFVMPSKADCFGIATVEAMASGLPSIVSNVGAAAEIVDDGETGWLIEPTPGDLAGALERALDRREDLSAMGGRARKVAEQRFDGERNDRAIVDVLVEILAAAGRWPDTDGASGRQFSTADRERVNRG